MPGTVCVACKIPNGLTLAVYASEDWQEPVLGGGFRPVKRAFVDPKYPRVKINGPAVAPGKTPKHAINYGAGLTFGVPADLFAAWLKQNEQSDFVVKKLVYAHGKPQETEAFIKDHEGEKSGLEPLDPDNMPREFAGKVATAPRS